jgi:ADP-ribose pyrophosphatase
MSIEFPSGGCEENFSVNENANKELLEETGYQTNEMSKIGEHEIINGLGKEVCHIFMATELEKITEPQPELNGEILEVICRRIDEFEEMIKRGDIWDGKTLAIWALAREHVLKIIKEQYGLQSN